MLAPNRVGTRETRRDSMEQAFPATISFIIDSIHRHTQPSPNETRTKHDYSDPQNHRRSPVDNKIECLTEDRCCTAGVRYLLGTIDDLYREVSEEVKDAVSHVADPGRFTVKERGIHVLKTPHASLRGS